MPNEPEDSGDLDLREEPPDPVTKRYARLIIQLAGGVNAAARLTKSDARSMARYAKGSKVMPWPVAMLLYLIAVKRR